MSKKTFREIGADLILMGIALPFLVWVVTAIFGVQSTQAVQESRYESIVETLKEIKEDVKDIKHSFK